MAASQSAREIAARIANLQQRIERLEKGSRTSQLPRSSIEDGLLDVNVDGQLRARWGALDDGTVAVRYMNGPPPPVPTAPLVGARQLGLAIYWDGKFAGSDRPADFQRVDVYMSSTPDFVPDGTTVVGSLTGEGVLMPFASVTTQYVRLVAVSTSDTASSPTAAVSGMPVPAKEIAAGSIGAGQLQADIILGSRIRLQDANGVTKVDLNGATGNATFSGKYQSAESGERIVINDNVSAGTRTINFYPATGDNSSKIISRTSLPDGDYLGKTGLLEAVGAVSGDGRAGRLGISDRTAILTYDTSLNSATSGTGPFGNGCFTASGAGAFVDGPNIYLRSQGQVTFIPNGDNINTLQMYADSNNAVHLYAPTKASGVTFGSSRVYVEDNTGNPKAITALSFNTPSSMRETKCDIQRIPFDSLSAVKAADVSRWRYKADVADRGGDAGYQIGPMLDDLPEQLWVEVEPGQFTLNLPDLIGVLWQAVRQLAAKVENVNLPGIRPV